MSPDALRRVGLPGARCAARVSGARWVALLGLTLSLAGCPEPLGAVERPESATPCETTADCNPGVAPLCGRLRACVDARCEATATRTVRCP